MRKTSVYLTDEEAEGLRRLALREGRAQAELIREGVRRVINEVEAQPRTFRSLGVGRGGGEAATSARWTSRELYDKAMGER
jgi:predicted DNA-binding protein